MFGIIVALLFFALLTVGEEGEGRSIIVDRNGEGDYSKVQDAVNASEDGDTIRVWEGVYHEELIILTTIDFIGNGSGETIINGSGYTVVRIYSDWVNMSGFSVTGGSDSLQAGVNVKAENCSIFDNSMYGNNMGLFVYRSKNCSISNNDCSNNGDGIQVSNSDDNSFLNNIFIDNGYRGLLLLFSDGNKIKGNICEDNIDGIKVSNSEYNYIEMNTCDDNIFGMRLEYSNNNILDNNSCLRNSDGIVLKRSNSNVISNNSCTNRYEDPSDIGGRIWLRESDNNVIIRNTCIGNAIGIHVSDGKYNSIQENVCVDLRQGLLLVDSNYTSILNNIYTFNEKYGIRIEGSRNSTIMNNLIEYNRYGIIMNISSLDILDQSGDIIQNNTIVNNTDYGMEVVDTKTSSEHHPLVNARYNYWGDATGPFHSTKNPLGLGDPVSDSIEFSPWYREPGKNESTKKNDSDEDYNLGFILIAPIVVLGFIGISGLAYLREDVRFLLLSLLPTPLYTKLEKNDILDQTNRRDIYSYIVNKPGTNFTKLHKDLPVGIGTLVHHLNILEREKHVRSKKEMGRKMFFPTGTDWVQKLQEGDMKNDEKKEQELGMGQVTEEVLSSVPVGIMILSFLEEHGPATQKHIEEKLGLKQTTVSHSIRKLEAEGRVEGSGIKRGAEYRLKIPEPN